MRMLNQYDRLLLKEHELHTHFSGESYQIVIMQPLGNQEIRMFFSFFILLPP